MLADTVTLAVTHAGVRPTPGRPAGRAGSRTGSSLLTGLIKAGLSALACSRGGDQASGQEELRLCNSDNARLDMVGRPRHGADGVRGVRRA